jgi:hypothetical protein
MKKHVELEHNTLIKKFFEKKTIVIVAPFSHELGVDANYSGSFFVFLWTFCKVYFIQMPQTHYKIINLTKMFSY